MLNVHKMHTSLSIAQIKIDGVAIIALGGNYQTTGKVHNFYLGWAGLGYSNNLKAFSLHRLDNKQKRRLQQEPPLFYALNCYRGLLNN
jgi:hypothetical protein